MRLGGCSFLPFVEQEVVQSHKWLAGPESLEIIGVVELFPGAIAIKVATYTGYKAAGVPGVVAANVVNLLPPVLFMTMPPGERAASHTPS